MPNMTPSIQKPKIDEKHEIQAPNLHLAITLVLIFAGHRPLANANVKNFR